VGPRTTKLEDHTLSAVRDCYLTYLDAVSSILNLRTPHAAVTRGPFQLRSLHRHTHQADTQYKVTVCGYNMNFKPAPLYIR